MLVLKQAGDAFFCCFQAVSFFPQVSLIMAILNTHKTRADNVRMVDVTNVSHQETKNKSVTKNVNSAHNPKIARGPW